MKDGHQSYCKQCAKIYYKGWADQSESRRYRHAEWKKARITNTRLKYLAYMRGKVCTDCPEDRLVVLQHDHVRGVKVAGVMDLINRGFSWEIVLEEIAKCEIRCATCHVIKTSIAGEWWNRAL